MDGSATNTKQRTSRKRRHRPSSSTMKPFKTILTTISIITFLSSTFNQSYYCNSAVVYAQATGLRKPHHHTTNSDYILDILSRRGPQHGLHSPRPRPSQDYYHVSNTNKLTSNRRLINSPSTAIDEHRQLSSDDTTTSNIAPTTSDNTLNTQRRAATWGEKGRDISHKEENIKRKKLNKLQQQKLLKLQELRARKNKKNKKKSNKPGRGGNKKPGKPGGRDKEKSKPGRGKNNNNNGGGGRSKKKTGRPNNNNGRSSKKPNNKKPNKKKPGRSTNKKPNNGGKNKPGSRPGSRPGKNNGGKNNGKPKPNQGQQGSGKEDKPDKLQSTLNGSGGKDKPDKPGRPNNKPNKPNNKPGKDEPSFIAVKPNNNKPDADSIKPQAKPQQQSSYQVVKPSKDKPKPNASDADTIKPQAKPQSNLQIALAYFNITKQDYKQLSAKQKEGILAMTDGQINFDEQQQQNDGYLSIGDNDGGGSDSGADGQFNFGNANSNSNTDMMEEQTTIMKSLKWNFVQDEITDYSTLLDSFEYTNTNLNWDYGDWKVIDSNIAYTKYDNGSKSLMSGINSQVYNQENNGQSIYSNITLSTNSNFNGGVITFKIKSKTLKLPNEALYVEVDDVATLAPDVISMGGSSINSKTNDDWKEYSIPVGNGKHTIKWVHVYNPFQLKSLPSPTDENGIGLYMDDIRYVPYTLQEHNNAWTNGMVEMKRGGYVIASNGEEEESSSNNNDEQHWKISNDGDTVKASSSVRDSTSSSGHSYIQFELYSFNGGLLTYRIKSSTSAPHDDFAISINNINVESIFGNMLGYESHSLSIPRGKAVITLKHRVNPGRLSSSVLRSLESGSSGSDGETLLKDLNFSW